MMFTCEHGALFIIMNGIGKQYMMRLIMNYLSFIQAADYLDLHSETIYLAVHYMDRLLATSLIPCHLAELFAVVCLRLASKLNDDSSPPVDEFLSVINDGHVTERVLSATEITILKRLEFRLSHVTPHSIVFRMSSRINHVWSRRAVIRNAHLFLDVALLGTITSAASFNCLRLTPVIQNSLYPSVISVVFGLFVQIFGVCLARHLFLRRVRSCAGWKRWKRLMILHGSNTWKTSIPFQKMSSESAVLFCRSSFRNLRGLARTLRHPSLWSSSDQLIHQV
jgi:hypothetical protein